jgi:hypothetical protein
MVHKSTIRAFAIALLLALPATSEAGPPLICHPFQTDGKSLLPWGDGTGWNNPNRRYDVQRLTADTLRLLSDDTPVLTRMENLRRATIYAAQDAKVADQLLAAVIARTQTATPSAHALFNAGYLIESFKQAVHMLSGPATPKTDGYALVTRAIALAGPNAEMEFAASLMTTGETAKAHRSRAQAGAAAGSLLARNIANLAI